MGAESSGKAPRMVCMGCGAEVASAVEQCPSCGKDLTFVPGDPQELVSVLDSTDVARLPVVKSVLQAAEIPFLVKGEEGFGLFPVGGVSGFFQNRAMGVSILVERQRAEEARALLASDATAAPPEE